GFPGVFVTAAGTLRGSVAVAKTVEAIKLRWKNRRRLRLIDWFEIFINREVSPLQKESQLLASEMGRIGIQLSGHRPIGREPLVCELLSWVIIGVVKATRQNGSPFFLAAGRFGEFAVVSPCAECS